MGVMEWLKRLSLTSSKSVLVVLASALVAGVIFVGCGDDDEPKDDSTADTTKVKTKEECEKENKVLNSTTKQCEAKPKDTAKDTVAYATGMLTLNLKDASTTYGVADKSKNLKAYLGTDPFAENDAAVVVTVEKVAGMEDKVYKFAFDDTEFKEFFTDMAGKTTATAAAQVYFYFETDGADTVLYKVNSKATHFLATKMLDATKAAKVGAATGTEKDLTDALMELLEELK